MATFFARLTILLYASMTLMPTPGLADTRHEPRRQAELMALVAGDALPENIANEVVVDGLAFRPDAGYRALLEDAGASSIVLKSVDGAKVVLIDGREDRADAKLLRHLSKAGKLIRTKQYDEAAQELTTAVTESFKSPESGFVMGELLRQKEDWQRAAAVYRAVLDQAPGFPEAHTKLSYILYRIGDDDEAALLEAKAALAITPENAEAHKNAGLALAGRKKFDAAELEYREALRLKPGYWAAQDDLGLMYCLKGAWDQSIAEYTKAVTINPDDAEEHYNLGYDYDQKKDFEAAIREYREAKRVDPQWYDARQNLGAALLNDGRYGEAVLEFREMVEMFPEVAMCRDSLGMALRYTGDLQGAEAQYVAILKMDPTYSSAYVGMGDIREKQGKYDEAVSEFEQAERLDPTNIDAYRGAGRVLIAKQDCGTAIRQMELAENLRPGEPDVHAMYGQALVGAGKMDAAIAEFKEALALDPKQIQRMIDLADAYEKSGDWVLAIAEYRRASLADSSIDFRGKVIRSDDRDPQKEYEKAQQRLNDHLTALAAAGKSEEVGRIKSAIRSTQAGAALSEQLDAAIQQGLAAAKAQHPDEAIPNFQKAVELAEKMQPHDERLVTALNYLGMCYTMRDPAAAQAAFDRELKAAQELFGSDSPNLTGPLQALAQAALRQHDTATAEKFYFRAVDLNEKTFGESSDRVADALVQATAVYFVQKDYAKAEPYLLRAVSIDEALYGKDSIGMAVPMAALCGLYERWDKPEKAEPCERQEIVMIEKQYGVNSPVLVPVLTSDAKALRSLGKENEAQQIDNRVASIRAATMKTN